MAKNLSSQATAPVPKDVVDPINNPQHRVTLANQQEMVDSWAQRVIQDVQRYANDTVDTVQRYSSDAARQVGRAYQTGHTYASENPGGTILTAFGVGLLIGLLIRD